MLRQMRRENEQAVQAQKDLEQQRANERKAIVSESKRQASERKKIEQEAHQEGIRKRREASKTSVDTTATADVAAYPGPRKGGGAPTRVTPKVAAGAGRGVHAARRRARRVARLVAYGIARVVTARLARHVWCEYVAEGKAARWHDPSDAGGGAAIEAAIWRLPMFVVAARAATRRGLWHGSIACVV